MSKINGEISISKLLDYVPLNINDLNKGWVRGFESIYMSFHIWSI